MAFISKLKQKLFSKDVTREEFETIALGILSDHQPRNVYQVLKEAEKITGRFLQASLLYTLLERLEEEGKVESWWGSPGRLYRLRE